MDKLVWEQDFTRNDLDKTLWHACHGNDLTDEHGNILAPGWGNGEQQFYTDAPGNVFTDHQGLHLCARQEQTLHGGKEHLYTSAKLQTKPGFAFCYGRLVTRAKLPVGAGLWPAIWLLPQQQAYGPWPASGEIDIMEAKGRLPQQVFGTLHHGKDYASKTTDEFCYTLPDTGIDHFHDYTLDWQPDAMRWLVDGHCFAQRKLIPGQMPFDRAFYIVLNLAVGGWYDNVPVDESALPAEMIVSSMRLYQ